MKQIKEDDSGNPPWYSGPLGASYASDVSLDQERQKLLAGEGNQGPQLPFHVSVWQRGSQQYQSPLRPRKSERHCAKAGIKTSKEHFKIC